MSKGLKIAYIAFALMAAFAVVGTVLVFVSSDSKTAQIISDGEVLYTMNISAAQDEIIRIDHGDSYNLVEITGGKIHVSEAGCPDKTCVSMGFLQGGAPIVCLPNRLVIRYVQSDGLDALAG